MEREPVLADMAAREEGGLLPLAGLAVLAGAAAGLICAIFRLVRGWFDHGARQGFMRLTGSWPGEEAPEAE